MLVRERVCLLPLESKWQQEVTCFSDSCINRGEYDVSMFNRYRKLSAVKDKFLRIIFLKQHDTKSISKWTTYDFI